MSCELPGSLFIYSYTGESAYQNKKGTLSAFLCIIFLLLKPRLLQVEFQFRRQLEYTGGSNMEDHRQEEIPPEAIRPEAHQRRVRASRLPVVQIR